MKFVYSEFAGKKLKDMTDEELHDLAISAKEAAGSAIPVILEDLRHSQKHIEQMENYEEKLEIELREIKLAILDLHKYANTTYNSLSSPAVNALHDLVNEVETLAHNFPVDPYAKKKKKDEQPPKSEPYEDSVF